MRFTTFTSLLFAMAAHLASAEENPSICPQESGVYFYCDTGRSYISCNGHTPKAAFDCRDTCCEIGTIWTSD
jgi:hypothetical protein